MKKAFLLFLLVLVLGSGMAAADSAEYPFRYDQAESGVVITGYDGMETEIIIPQLINGKQVVGIGKTVFFAKGITRVSLPDGIRWIDSEAFCENPLTQINLPDTLEIIGADAFANTRLREVVIPNSVKIIERTAFYQCTELKASRFPPL